VTSYDEARFYRSANTAVAVGTGVVTGLALGWAIHHFSLRTWLYFISSQVFMWWGILSTPEAFDDNGVANQQTGVTPFQWCLYIIAVVLFVAAIKEAGASIRRKAMAAQAQVAAQVAQAPAPTVTRTTRTVTVTRAPVRNDDAQHRSQGTTGTSPGRSTPARPVRSIEQHGNLRITDRRPFDPEIGE